MKAEKNVQYQLKLSSRRTTVSIQVKKDGSVVVLAPKWLDCRRIEQILAEKQQWIASQQVTMKKLYRPPIHHEYHAGEQFYLLGVPYILKLAKYIGRRAVVNEQHRFIVMDEKTDPKTRKQKVRDIYRRIGERYVEEHLSALTDAVTKCNPGRTPRSVRFRSMKRRWGSCSHAGVITLSLRLFGADPELIDYVIVHELAHLHHFHHQSSFYCLLDAVMPDWRRRRSALERISGDLII